MPQMMPLNWITLYYFFILTFMIMMIMNFYFNNKKLTSHSVFSISMKSQLMTWTW
uniref:ATP synthase F0 subunit 8 n=1 Tax=Marilia sp. XG-2021 TaxID=2996736 RepID=A0A9E8LNZ7_9NEOP|nr:ATP synthase F0 subunit 8 [Marilia sp. XG-2021]